jgi:type IV secretion system protein VirB4
MNIAEIKNKFTRSRKTYGKNSIIPDLPWAVLLGYGVVLSKKGYLQKTFAFRGPDLQAADGSIVNQISQYINVPIMRLGTGWAVQWHVHHYTTNEYPGAIFTHPAAYLIDKEREKNFTNYGKHFESAFYITFMYKPPVDLVKKSTGLFFEQGRSEKSMDGEMEKFLRRVFEITRVLSSKMMMSELDDDETIQLLHISCTLKRHYLRAPMLGYFLDNIMNDVKIDNTTPLRIGTTYTPIVSINDFPTETYPAILDDLNKANHEYIWMTRFICQDKQDTLKEVEKKQAAFYGQRQSWGQLVMSVFTKEQSGRVDHGAMAHEEDINTVQVEVSTDLAGYGQYTSSIMVWDEDLEKAQVKANDIQAIIQKNGFSAIIDDFNCFESYKSMMVGDFDSNLRKDPISTVNLSHVVPISSIWKGLAGNDHLAQVTGLYIPHVVCSTGYDTPFFLNLNYAGVGHTMCFGPTGGGKSTFLQLLEAQWMKYPGAQVVIFDVDKSAKRLTKAMNGLYFEPGEQAEFTLQPLENIGSMIENTWASEFIEMLLVVQGIKITPSMTAAITKTIQLMMAHPKENRTITSFCLLCDYLDKESNENTIRLGLYTYTAEGKYGKLFDGASSTIKFSDWTMIEMRKVMNLGEGAIAPVLMYLFHYIEAKFNPANPTLLVLDEMWRFLSHPTFADKIQDWLLTTRKQNVYCVFATQEISAALSSPIATTLISQIYTKIYLADESANKAKIKELYEQIGLNDEEIEIISAAQMRHDYYFKSPAGVRLFQLDLGNLALALFSKDNLEELDAMDESDSTNVYKILDQAGVEYDEYFQQEN